MSDSTKAGFKIGLGVSGGISAYKAAEILRLLQRAGCDVRVAMTKHACEFITPLTFRALSGQHVIVDDYAADNPDPIAHITFGQSIDLLLVAPATANIIGKLANGIADDFLSSTYLANSAPVMLAPAMNSRMLAHPATARNIATLRADGVHILTPDEGEMACGTIGPGRLAAPEVVVAAALALLNDATRKDLTDERVLITTGATREEIDPVRFISNYSSGKMGFALAEAARQRGADVTVVAGVTSAAEPVGVKIVRAVSARAMYEAVLERLGSTTLFVGAAAVADYRPSQRREQKLKKTDAAMTIELERTDDILAGVARMRTASTIVVGFAAETDNLLANARAKLDQKQIDLMVANDVTQAGAGFESDTNVITILRRDSDAAVALPLQSKLAAAHKILDCVIDLRTRRAAGA